MQKDVTRGARIAALGLGVGVAAAASAIAWRSASKARKQKAEGLAYGTGSVLINKPLDEVRAYFAAGDSQLKSLGEAMGDRHFTGKIGERLWTLELEPRDQGRMTLVRGSVSLSDGAGGGKLPLGAVAAAELRDCKALIETGEMATVKGQPHGQRGLIGAPFLKATESVHAALEAEATHLVPNISHPEVHA